MRFNARLLAALLALTFATFLVSASSASALSYGVMWRDYDIAHLDAVQESGATVYRIPLDYVNTPGNDWTSFDKIVEAAWKRDITILPNLIRSGPSGNRFPLQGDPVWNNWYAWAQAAVERYGVNGSFWNGKANPRPVTAWEVWNEPNLAENNPQLSEAQCKKEGLPVVKDGPGVNCVQPQNYGRFLNHTATAIQAGSLAKTANTTQVLFGGLFTPAGESVNSFLSKAYAVPGVSSAFTGLSLHPYAFSGGLTEFKSTVEGTRAHLTSLPGGSTKSLWITEMGWPVSGTGLPGGSPVSEADQATLLTQSFDWLAEKASPLNLQLVTWYNVRDGAGGHWDRWCGLLRENGSYRPSWYAFQKETGAELTGSGHIAFQANNFELYHYPSPIEWGVPTGMGMEAGTSPSIARIPRGGYMIAFQDWQNHLWIYSTATGIGVDTGMGMHSGTDPSIAYVPGEGYLIAFQDWQKHLWLYSTASKSGFNTTLGMEAGTSPSLAVRQDGSYSVAFQANNNELYYYPSPIGWGVPTGMGMNSGTNPSIAALPGGGYRIAFQNWQKDLWLYSTASESGFNTTLGMEAGTSPSLAVKPDGNYSVAFQANNNELYYYPSPIGWGVPTGMGMRSGTSPSIASIPAGGYRIAFQDWQKNLWFYLSATGAGYNTTLGMESKSSPSFAIR